MTITQDPHQTPVGDPSEEPAPSSSSSTTSTASTPPQDTAQDIQNNSSDSEEDGAVPSEDEDEDEDTRADLDDLEDTPQPPPTASATPIVDALRAQLAELGLSTKGNKQTLKKRLRAAKKKSVGAKKERLDLAWEENVERHAGHGWGWDGKASSGGDDEEEDGDEGDDEDRPESAQPFNYYAVFDVEATCVSDGGWEYPNEIIEFPIVLVDGRTLEVVDEFHRYVRPVINPKLSDFCKELTGITQEDIDKADPFTTVLSEFESWLSKYAKYPFTRRVMFVTDGPWDLRDFARKQCEASLISRPPYWRRWVDVRKLHHGFYDRPQRENIAGMLKHFGMEFEGREHCGLHDARNIARIAIRMMKDGCIFVPNGEMKLSKRKVNKRGQVRFTKASNNSKWWEGAIVI